MAHGDVLELQRAEGSDCKSFHFGLCLASSTGLCFIFTLTV